MKIDFSNLKWPLPVVIGVICAIVLMVLITRSLVSFFRSSPETASGQSAATAGATADKAASRPDVKAISAFSEHPIMSPTSKPVSSPAAIRPQPKPAPAVFKADFQGMQERAKAQRATIENMRQAIRSGDKDTNTIRQQEKKLQKIEDSGDSFM